jgi:hypothetical protein
MPAASRPVEWQGTLSRDVEETPAMNFLPNGERAIVNGQFQTSRWFSAGSTRGAGLQQRKPRPCFVRSRREAQGRAALESTFETQSYFHMSPRSAGLGRQQQK